MTIRILSLISLLALSALPARAFSEADFSGWWSSASLQVETAAVPSFDFAFLWLFAAPLAAAVVVAGLVLAQLVTRSRS